MNHLESSLDISRLEKVRHHASGKVTARCPACAEEGRDKTGSHLAIFPDGRFACAAFPGDAGHRRLIFAHVGNLSDTLTPSPELQRKFRQHRNEEERRRHASERVSHAARKHREGIIARHPWELAEVWQDSPQRIDSDLVESCPRHFLASLYQADSILWTGEVHSSGEPRHRDNWKRCEEWVSGRGPIGPMTTPAIWNAGTFSRAGRNVVASPYVVLDFDGFDGVKPTTADALEIHLRASLALIRWLREGRGWRLAAILHTGGKSLHTWFHAPPAHVLVSLAHAATALGMDAGLIGRPEHPCRLPGQKHSHTGNLSRVLWLQEPQSSLPSDHG